MIQVKMNNCPFIFNTDKVSHLTTIIIVVKNIELVHYVLCKEILNRVLLIRCNMLRLFG